MTIVLILLLVLGTTTVFYAHISAHPVGTKTAVAAVGCFLIFLALFWVPGVAV